MPRLGLAWVLVDGQPRCVSDFAALPPRRRPRPSCPLCGRSLTLKLGRMRRHHAAHAPNDDCAATAPETALHIDTKLYLAAQLRASVATDPALVIRRRCEDTPLESCDVVRDERRARGWNEVSVEAGVAAASRLRPDILLAKDGVLIAAIEVLVSHRVSDEQAVALEEAGLPWIEVRADSSLLEGASAWSLNRILPVERLGRRGQSRTWRCDAHLRRSRRLRGARVVDIYRPAGVHYRAIYRVDEQRVEDAVMALVLRRDGREVASHPCDDTTQAQRAAWRALRTAFTEDVRRTVGQGAFADSPMGWASCKVLQSSMSLWSLSRFGARIRWWRGNHSGGSAVRANCRRVVESLRGESVALARSRRRNHTSPIQGRESVGPFIPEALRATTVAGVAITAAPPGPSQHAWLRLLPLGLPWRAKSFKRARRPLADH
jgi:hypothetical protein